MMAKQLRYMGEFLSRAGVAWRVELLQEAEAEFAEIGALTFPADEPLTIEWRREDKEEPLLGSSATLKIVSPGDRTYEDLYTVEVGNIRMDVYRNNQLYWSGTLDPEFYEEPYECLHGYEVELTFSDFGILDRLKYDLTGYRTLQEIITYALQRAGINYGHIDTTYVSTTFTDGSPITGGGLSVRSDNFIDEDGEQSTLEDVVKGILQPLALRMVQRAGNVFIYDLNGLHTLGEAAEIEWDGDSQTMGTDKVANNVTITFSPYASAELMPGEIGYLGKYDVEHINRSNQRREPGSEPAPEEYGEYYSYYPDYSDKHRVNGDWDVNLVDFTIFLSHDAKGLKSIGEWCRYFHILPVTGSAGECDGVAYAFRTGGHCSSNLVGPTWVCNTRVGHCTRNPEEEVLTTNRVFIPKLDEKNHSRYSLRLTEELCIDARYNPFSGSNEGNDEANDYTLKVCSAFVFIPVSITLYDENDVPLYHYRNFGTAETSAVGSLGYMRHTGQWVPGADPGGECYLEYYPTEDPRNECGIRGWTSNRHCIGRPDGRNGRRGWLMYESFAKLPEGEYIPFPPVAGYLEIKILAGVNGYDFDQNADNCNFGSLNSQWDQKMIYRTLRWCLYKAPTLAIVTNNLAYGETEMDDIEYVGALNSSAKEDIDIDTICGTTDEVCPAARGVYYRTTDYEQIMELRRDGRDDHPEKLLIGTLYSQYADRKTTLSGEAAIDGGLHYYTEANQGEKRFMLMEDVQDLITDCTEAEYCEFDKDQYDSVRYE